MGEKFSEVVWNFRGSKYSEIFEKVVFLEISKNFLLTGFECLQSPGCNAIKNKLLTRFLGDVLKILKNVPKVLCNGVFFSKLQA